MATSHRCAWGFGQDFYLLLHFTGALSAVFRRRPRRAISSLTGHGLGPCLRAIETKSIQIGGRSSLKALSNSGKKQYWQ
jgi:hypothetical protein